MYKACQIFGTILGLQPAKEFIRIDLIITSSKKSFDLA